MLLVALVAAGCGPGIDREATLTRLRSAIEEDVGDPTVLEEHNRVVEDVVRGNVLDGMRQHEVEERLGRGQQCGTRDICARRSCRPSDWVYEVGRRDGLPAGPTLVVCFDRQGIFDGAYYLTRR